jgi:hypothetical protein
MASRSDEKKRKKEEKGQRMEGTHGLTFFEERP